ncbi:MAG: hypothetical protein E3J56_12115 [Candidatus Aminicenantes bacterium]|nr:MAG: hypothetical protein E3J56_12115 [Candidatus Aminicenantes bacterium]
MKKKKYTIRGFVIDTGTDRGITGLRVEAWDKDLLFDDYLGSCETDRSGKFRIEFKDKFRDLFLERKPDIYFKVLKDAELIADTKDTILWNVSNPDINVTIPIDYSGGDVQKDYYVISGFIRHAEGSPCSNLKVKAYVRDLRSEEFLGEMNTEKNGHYKIFYSQSQFKKAEKRNADLIIRVFDAKNDLLVESDVLFNAPDKAKIDLMIPTNKYKLPSEYARISEEITPLLDGMPIKDLEEDDKHQDVGFISGETNLLREHIEYYILAHKLEEKSKIQPEFWYGMLRKIAISLMISNTNFKKSLAGKMKHILTKASELKKDEIKRALEKAISENIIDESCKKKINEWLKQFQEFYEKNISSVGKSKLSRAIKLLKDTELKPPLQEKFIALYRNHMSFNDELRKEIQKDSSLKKHYDELESTFTLSDHAMNNISLVKALKDDMKDKKLISVQELAKKSKGDFENLIKKDKNIIKEVNYVKGKTDTDKIKNYAALLHRRFRDAYPTTSFAGELERDKKPPFKMSKDLISFFDKHPEFELHRMSVDGYIKKNLHSDFRRRKNDEKKNLVQELKTAQRVFKLTQSYEASSALLKDNIHSAQQIYRMGKKKFINAYSGKSGLSEVETKKIYERATNTYSVVLTLATELKATEQAMSVKALTQNSQALTDFASYQNLFGKADMCDCKHCRSVYSPSAYFADLLMYLSDRDSTTAGVSAKDILFARRPDLGFIELSCENSHTPLPYIDLVCEILEYVVAPQKLFGMLLTEELKLTEGVVHNDIKTEFDNNTTPLSNDATVSQMINSDTWMIRDDSSTYRVTREATELAVYLQGQTRGTAEELSALPEYVNAAAYAQLKTEKYPFSLPFDLFAEEIRAYLEKMKINRAEIMKEFKGNAALYNSSAFEIACEFFGIADAEKSIIFSQDIGNQFEYWGESTNAIAITEVGKVDVFLRKTGLTYNDLLTLLSLEYINGDNSLEIIHDDTSCDTHQKHIQILNANKLDKMNRFLRLWGKLNFQMWKLDLVIMHTGIGNGDIGENLIKKLKPIIELKDRFPKLSIEQVCSFYGYINTKEKFTAQYEKPDKSLYAELFLNKKLINPIDPAFEVSAVDVPSAPTLPDITDLSIPVIAALCVKETELQELLNLKKPDGAPCIDGKLTLSNLSFLYRHTVLAKLLNLKIEDWAGLFMISLTDVFSDPQATIDFIEQHEAVKSKELSIEDLKYLLKADLTSQSAPAEDGVTLFLANLRSELASICGEYEAGSLPVRADELNEGLSHQFQALGWSEGDITKVLDVLNNRNIQAVHIPSLPDGTTFSSAVQDIQISLDMNTKILTFTGVMTDAEKTALDAEITTNTDYRNAIQNFYDSPRNDILKRIMKFYTPYVYEEPLDKLPTTVRFTDLSPDDVTEKVLYDAERKVLQFKGDMTLEEKSKLDGLSSDSAYRTAIQNLYNAQNTTTYDDKVLLIKDADIGSLFNTPTTIDVINNLQFVLSKVLNYLRRTLSEGLVVQLFSETLELTASVTKKLLTNYKISSANPQRPIIEDFTDALFVNDPNAMNYLGFKEIYDLYYWLHRVAMIIQKMSMEFIEIDWLIQNESQAQLQYLLQFQTLPLDAATPLPAGTFDKLCSLIKLFDFHDRYSNDVISLIEIIEKIINNEYSNESEFADDVALLTNWSKEEVENLTIIFDLVFASDYTQINAWIRMKKCIVILNRLNGSTGSVKEFSKYVVGEPEVNSVRQMIKSKYEYDQWLDVSKPIQDALRERKRDSLTAYILVQPAPAGYPSGKWENANDLYSCYLIDVEMSSCQPSSRIVQASGAVQLFVQRCFLGLEPGIITDIDIDDAWEQWKWMAKYRVWEANRKVFLYAENWIEPELRRNKSPFFKDLENELLQNEINRDTVETAFLNYIEKLDEVKQLEIAGTYYEDVTNTHHIFARSPGGEPYIFYYRQWVDDRRWTAWERVEVDIKSDYIIPLVMNRRLYLLWPELREEPVMEENLITDIPFPGDPNVPIQEPKKRSKLHLAISEYRNKKWSPKKVSQDYLQTDSYHELDKSRYFIAPLDFTDETLGLDHIDGKFLIMIPNMKTAGIIHRYSSSGTVFTDIPGNYASVAIQPIYSFYKILNNETVFELLGCKGYPEEFAGAFRTLLYPTLFDRTNLQNMNFAEDATEGSLIPTSGYMKSLSDILEKTPGSFRITYPHQLSYFDKLIMRMFVAAFNRHGIPPENWFVMLSLGTFLNWFYTDKEKTFFIRPQLLSENGSSMFYKDLIEFIKSFIDLYESDNTEELYNLVIEFYEAHYQFKLLFKNFYHPFTCLFAKEIYNRGIDGLMKREVQLKDNYFDFIGNYSPASVVNPEYPQEVVDFDPDGSYSLYNWELFFHAPLMIATQLSKNQQFEEAMQWFHYIFHPMDTSSHPVPRKYWITKPFFERQEQDYIKQRIDNILGMLSSDPTVPEEVAWKEELVRQVRDWRESPFDPHMIAQTRTVAYQKTVIMKYIDTLIAWGDQLFRRDSMESINEATQLYILAAEILGPRPKIIPPVEKPKLRTFNELKDTFDAFTNAVIEFENLIPDTGGDSVITDDSIRLPGLLYFCIPHNDNMLKYWDTVADRVYKIRHCLTIEGVARQVALFEPPIDPGALVKAAAAGIDISSALSDLNAPLPYYKFHYMIKKANEFCNDVKALGNALLAALEKRDAEDLALLRQTHEIQLMESIKDVRQKQIDEAKETLDGLKMNKELITIRRDFYQNIEKINASEKLQQDKLEQAYLAQTISQSINIAASVAHVVPSFDIGASGIGGTPKASVMFGGPNVGSALQAASGGFVLWANIENYKANKASIKAGHDRHWDDWKLQEDLANKELDQIDKQIAVAEIRISIAEKELENQELQIENSKIVDEFMKSKFTNKDLYQWMITQVSQVYFQSYQLAYDIAKQAEKCYRFELGIEDSSYMQFGYWDSLKKGLLSGEKLQHDLRRLDAAYLENNKRDFELTKHISLSLINPRALVELKQNGKCIVQLPEELFDLDYSGHYFRRIKSVSISIPCITGPYTTINCTLRLLRNTVRINTNLTGQYEHNNTDGIWDDDERFRDSNIALKAIATSNAQNDSGMFELNFRDERYIPFEGAGAISEWLIELTEDQELRQFDYDTISDVIIHLRYTAREDAGRFKDDAITHVKDVLKNTSGYNNTPLLRIFSAKKEFPTQWHRFLHPQNTGDENILELDVSKEKFPFFTQNQNIKINSIVALAKCNNTDEYKIKLTPPLIPPPPADYNIFTLNTSDTYQGLHFGSKDVSGDTINLVTSSADIWKLKMRKTSTSNFNSLAVDEVDNIIIILGYQIT